MTDTRIEPDESLSVFDDAELRFLRKTVSMQQGSLETRHGYAAGGELKRVKRDIETASTAYPKIQKAINIRLLGDEDE